MRQMVHARQHRAGEHFAIGDHSAHRYAAKSDAVIGLFPANKARAVRLAAQPVVAERDFEAGVDGFGTGAGEEHPIQVFWCQLGDSLGQTESGWTGNLKRRHVIHTVKLLFDGLHDLRVAVPQSAAP